MKSKLQFIMHFPRLFFEAAKEFVSDRCEQLAGAIAFFELLSIAPLAAFFYLIFSSLPGLGNVEQRLTYLLEMIFSPQVTDVIRLLLRHLENIEEGTLFTLSLAGTIGLLISTTGFYGQIKDSLEIIWNERREQVGLKEAFIRRFEDLKISVIGTGILFIFLAFRMYTWDFFLSFDYPVIRFLMQLVVLTVLNFYFFAFLPPVRFKRIHALPGAVLGAFFHIAGKALFDRKMVADAGFDVSDEAQNLVMLLLWFYYAAVIRLFCAQFSKVYIEKREGFKVLGAEAGSK